MTGAARVVDDVGEIEDRDDSPSRLGEYTGKLDAEERYGCVHPRRHQHRHGLGIGRGPGQRGPALHPADVILRHNGERVFRRGAKFLEQWGEDEIHRASSLPVFPRLLLEPDEFFVFPARGAQAIFAPCVGKNDEREPSHLPHHFENFRADGSAGFLDHRDPLGGCPAIRVVMKAKALDEVRHVPFEGRENMHRFLEIEQNRLAIGFTEDHIRAVKLPVLALRAARAGQPGIESARGSRKEPGALLRPVGEG